MKVTQNSLKTDRKLVAMCCYARLKLQGVCLNVHISISQKQPWQIGMKIVASISFVALLVNFIFTTLTIVTLCCRACGYNPVYEDCCYNGESQEGTERDTTILLSYSAFFLLYLVIFWVIDIHRESGIQYRNFQSSRTSLCCLICSSSLLH